MKIIETQTCMQQITNVLILFDHKQNLHLNYKFYITSYSLCPRHFDVPPLLFELKQQEILYFLTIVSKVETRQ